MDSHEKDRLYREGLEAFNSRQFFEAHELWEDVWRETAEPDRRFLQGLIHVAAAFHHYARSNVLGTQRQLRRGLLRLEAFPAVHCGLRVEPLRAEVRGWLAALENKTLAARMSLPQISRDAATHFRWEK